MFVYTIQPVVKPVVKLCLSNRFDKHGLTNRFDKHGLTTVLNEQFIVQHGCQTGCTTRFDNRLYTPYSRFVKPVVKQPVECLYTRYNRLSYRYDKRFDNGFDNRLYHVNGASVFFMVLS